MNLRDSSTNPPVGDASVSAPDASVQQMARVSGVETTLNLRSGPSTDDAILESMSLGCLVTLLGETNGTWLRVDYRGTVGWASSQYLTNVPAGTADCN